MIRIYFIFCFLLLSFTTKAQILTANRANYTAADSLRGSLRPERTSYDVKKYNINLKVDPSKKYISGVNKMQFKVIDTTKTIQIDLFENMKLDSVIYNTAALQFDRKFNAVFIHFPKALVPHDLLDSLSLYFSGYPKVARNAPWDGGFVFKKDKNGNDFVGLAVQGTGASLWLPNKDHLSDEPEAVDITIACPKNLVAVSNGQLVDTYPVDDHYTAYKWSVTNPINNYNITVNIGDYVHFEDQFKDLKLDYYVLRYNLKKAKAQFEQVKPMMSCFYQKFGEYPFKDDTYKLVESPYLGMEHQSAVAYGNKYSNGYLGSDLSRTGIGLKWDYIIIHETAHEWFGNSISVADVADLWIHESFTTYAESVFVECQYGKAQAEQYVVGQRASIRNNKPMIGDYGVNAEGSGDMYFKGANMLHSIRNYVNNDDLWWKTLKDFHENFKYKTTNTNEVVAFFEQQTNLNLAPIFNQYLNYTKPPELVIKKTKKGISVKWNVDVSNFELPVEIIINGQVKRHLINAEQFKNIKLKKAETFQINDQSFYFTSKVIN